MERVPINAPQGPLGLIFEPESTVLSKVRETSPLYGRVEVGWTLVAVDREDVSHMDGSQVTKLLKMRSRTHSASASSKSSSSGTLNRRGGRKRYEQIASLTTVRGK